MIVLKNLRILPMHSLVVKRHNLGKQKYCNCKYDYFGNSQMEGIHISV